MCTKLPLNNSASFLELCRTTQTNLEELQLPEFFINLFRHLACHCCCGIFMGMAGEPGESLSSYLKSTELRQFGMDALERFVRLSSEIDSCDWCKNLHLEIKCTSAHENSLNKITPANSY